MVTDFSDAKKATKVSREHQRLSSLVEKFEQYHKVEQQLLDILKDTSTDIELLPLIGRARSERGKRVLSPSGIESDGATRS